MLRIEGLTSGYSAIPVLNGVSIKVEEGQFVAIVGPNGAGKTTLFKTISGIVRPSAGTIKFEDHDLLSIRPAQRAHLGIAHVPEGRQVFPSLTVMENLEMGAMTEAGQRDWKFNIERIFEWLPILSERRGRPRARSRGRRIRAPQPRAVRPAGSSGSIAAGFRSAVRR